MLPANVVTSVPGERFCTMPAATKTIAPTTAIGSSSRKQMRVRSTQKLPRPPLPVRAKPRIKAKAIAIPTAADAKF
jgi:hypothetical protein